MIRQKLIKRYWSDRPPIFKEILLFAGMTAIAFIIAISFDLFEHIVVWSRQYEHLEIDELVTLSVLLFAAAGIFSFRRWKELQRESHERKHAEQMLREAHDALEHRVQQRTVELIRANDTLERQITVRQKAEHELMQYRQHLEELVEARTRELRQQVADRRQAEYHLTLSLQEKEILLKEIHHRVKNNLQVISSLLNLQAAALPDEQTRNLFKESQGRVKTMALIHEKLYQSESLQNIDFGEYVRTLVSELYTSYRPFTGNIGLLVDIDHVHLAIDTAIPCSLILNELVSNALKYAFPHNEGTVRISMRSPSENQFELLVADNGVGLPVDFAYQVSDSLGLQLVQGLVEEQLNSSLELDRSHGTSWVIRFQESA